VDAAQQFCRWSALLTSQTLRRLIQHLADKRVQFVRDVTPVAGVRDPSDHIGAEPELLIEFSNERSRPASVLSVPPAKPTTTFGWNPKQSWLYHSLAIAPAASRDLRGLRHRRRSAFSSAAAARSARLHRAVVVATFFQLYERHPAHDPV
jgi:hypothetical protein